MACWTPFTLKCQSCGHVNWPSRSPRAGITAVINGSFRRCQGCGREFTKIRVPGRPMVYEIIGLQRKPLPKHIEIFAYQSRRGSVPKALGII